MGYTCGVVEVMTDSNKAPAWITFILDTASLFKRKPKTFKRTGKFIDYRTKGWGHTVNLFNHINREKGEVSMVIFYGRRKIGRAHV